MKRSGFTMIELIFVIVILGILAAVAIPKLAATRDDAKVSTAVTNLSTAINDLGSEYTAKGSFAAMPSLDCFTASGTSTGVLTITAASGGAHCTAAGTMATAKGLVATHTFGGTSVSF